MSEVAGCLELPAAAGFIFGEFRRLKIRVGRRNVPLIGSRNRWRPISRRTAMRKLLCLSLISVALLATYATGADRAERLSLRIAVPLGPVDTWPVLAGIEKGIFEKHGLDLKANTSIQSGPEAIKMMQAGEAELGLAGVTPLAVARAKDVPAVFVVLLSGGYRDDRFVSILSMAGKGIRANQPGDLSGKQIGVTLGTTGHEYLLAVLGRHRVPLASVRLTNIKPSEMAVALQQGDVDAVAIWEPTPTFILEKVKGSVLVTRGGGYVSTNAGVVVLEDVLRKNRPTIKRLVVAMSEANQWVRRNPDETARIAARWVPGLDVEVARKALPLFSFDGRLSKPTAKGIEETLTFLVAEKRLDRMLDVSRMADSSLINEAMKEHPALFSDLKPLAKDESL
jgi:ABC-type nitrate/sulfonate/bicarbonate transport system substrate-binding protein